MILRTWQRSLGNLTLADAMAITIAQSDSYIWKIFRVIENYEDDLGSDWKSYLKPIIDVKYSWGDRHPTDPPKVEIYNKPKLRYEDLNAEDWYICHRRSISAFLHILRGDRPGTKWYKDWSKVGGNDPANLQYKMFP